MNAPVVHKVYFDNRVTSCFKDLRQGETDKVIADVPQVERFIGIW
jgi:hypothetical protein